MSLKHIVEINATLIVITNIDCGLFGGCLGCNLKGGV